MERYFKQTSTDGISPKKLHYHVGWFDEILGRGTLATANKHTHDLIWHPPVPEQPEQQDPMTGQIIPGQPGQPGYWEVAPAEDGHTHPEIIDYQYAKPPKKERADDAKLCGDVLALYEEGRAIEAESFKQAKRSEEYYRGEHWSATDKSYLEGLDRAALTINYIERNIDDLAGYQRKQRTDLHYIPLEEGDQGVADVLNHMSKYILSRCRFPLEESKAFEDQAITGRGNWHIYVSNERDLRGEIIVERFPWEDVVYGPHEKEDLSDCEYVIKHKFYSLSRIKHLWPRHANKIEQDLEARSILGTADSASTDNTQHKKDHYAKGDNWKIVPNVSKGGDVLVDVGQKNYRVIECQRKIYSYGAVAVYADDISEVMTQISDWRPTDIDALREISEIDVIEAPTVKIRITRIAGGVVLTDQNPAKVPGDDFTLIPIYAKKRGNQYWGKVKAAMDPQDEINKRHSQMVDIGNKMAAYIWFMTPNSFVDESEANKFRNTSSQPGAVFMINDFANKPQKEAGIEFPREASQLYQMGENALSRLMGVQVEPTGANQSGSHFLQMREEKIRGSEYLFDNTSFGKQKLGRLLAHYIPEFYSAARIKRILLASKQEDGSPIQINGQPIDAISESDIELLLSDIDVEQYDVEVTESSFGPSARTGLFLTLTELASKGVVAFPPEIFIDAADIPQQTKAKYKEILASQQQAEAEASDKTYQMELDKVFAAKGVMTPNVKKYLSSDTGELDGSAEVPQDGASAEQIDTGGDILTSQ